jgi:hypothetical protein
MLQKFGGKGVLFAAGFRNTSRRCFSTMTRFCVFRKFPEHPHRLCRLLAFDDRGGHSGGRAERVTRANPHSEGLPRYDLYRGERQLLLGNRVRSARAPIETKIYYNDLPAVLEGEKAFQPQCDGHAQREQQQ